MQKEAPKKAFNLSHERFVLEVDPSQRFIKGLAELTIQPLSKLSNIRINCRQCSIEKIFVNDESVEYDYVDSISNLTLGSNTTIAHHQVYKSRYLNALRDANEGELNVKIPSHSIQQIETNNKPSETEPPPPPPPPPPAGIAADTPTEPIEPTFRPLIIRIQYTLEDPRNGVVFVQKDNEIAPYRSNHVYTVHQPLPGATRAWLPCIDRISERCTWDMEFIVPRKEDGASVPEYDGEGAFDEVEGMMVVCSGDVVEQVIHPTDTSKKIVHYSLSVPTPAPFIGFAIGPFEMIKLSPSQLQEEVMTAADLDESQQQSLMAEINMMSNIYAFALPGLDEELSVTCNFLMHAMHFYTQEYGSYPFSDYKLVFVEDAWSDTASCASLAICSSRLLHPADVIDQIYHTRRELSQALARQWFGIYIVQKSWPDTWLVRGLANLMGSLFIKRHLGNNEYRLRLKKDMELCCMLDVNRPPLYNPALPYPLDPEDLDFIELKSPLVIYMLDKRMCKGGGTLGLSRVLPKILVSAMSGELSQNAISTHYFLRICRKISGFDTKVFAEQWIYRSGCPRFAFSFHFNRKKMVVEIFMRQENTNTPLLQSQEHISLGGPDSITSNYYELMSPIFTGNLTVRIHEADGTPYEHILDIQSMENKFEVQFNTKYKRIRRNTKRFLAKQAAAAAAVAEEEQENEEGGDGTTVLGIIPSLGLGMPVFEDPKQKADWRIVEWGQDEEDTSGAASAMFDWIRLDAEFEWLCICDFKQPDYMWAAQLTKDRDVVAQHEAIDALKHMPSSPTSTSLLRAALDPKCFYKIRMEAAYGLAACARPSLNWVGLHQLNKMFQKRFCFPVSSLSRREIDPDEEDLPLTNSIPKPNNFSNLSDYFLQKASVVAFSQIRDDRGLTPVRIRQFLLDLLKYNDNIGNEFSDCYYVATLISSLGDALIPSSDKPDALQHDSFEGQQVTAAAKAEIERFRTLDYVIPTYHNTVTVTCLRTLTKLMLKELMPVNLSMFMQYTRYGNFLEVRLAAFDSLFILCGLSDPTLNHYFLSVIKEDPCVYVCHYVARAMLAWLGLAVRENAGASNAFPVRATEDFSEEDGRIIVDDDTSSLSKTPQQEFQASIENLRKRFENDTVLQQSLWDLLNSSENAKLDHCIRKYLLQFCEYMFKPIDVGLKVTIRVPTLPSAQESKESVSEPSTPTTIRLNKPKQKSEDKQKTHKKPTNIYIKTEALSKQMEEDEDEAVNVVSSPESVDQLIDIDEPTSDKPAEPVTTVVAPLSRHRSPSPPPAPVKERLPLPAPSLEDKKPSESKSIKLMPPTSSTSAHKVVPSTSPAESTAAPATASIKHKHKKLEESDESKKERKIKIRHEKSSKSGSSKPHKIPKMPTVNNSPVETAPEPSISNSTSVEKPKPKSLTLTTHASSPSQTPSTTVVEKPKSKPKAHVPMTTPSVNKSSPVTVADSNSNNNPPHAVSNISNGTKPKTSSIGATTPSYSVDPSMNETNRRKAERVLKKLCAHQASQPFLDPVDAVGLNIPQYYEVIKRPMHLNAIRKNFQESKYKDIWQMENDVRQIFWNCYSFNDHESWVAKQCQALEAFFNQIWSAEFAHPNALKGEDKRIAQKVVNKLTLHDAAALFNEPVDLESLPDYATIVKHPMDLRTIWEHLESGKYTSLKSLDQDIRLVFKNCFAYNAPGTFGSDQGKKLEKYYQNISREMRARISHAAPATPSASSSTPAGTTVSVAGPTVHTSSAPKRPSPQVKSSEEQQATPPPPPKKLKAVHSTEPINDSMDIDPIVLKSPTAAKPSVITKPAPSTKLSSSHKSSPVTKSPSTNSVSEPPAKLHPSLHAKMKSLLSKVMKKPEAMGFLEPVDPIALCVPHYPMIIKKPMDLGTMMKKLNNGQYKTVKEFESDMRLIFTNCYTFNGFDHLLSQHAKTLENILNKEGPALRRREEELRNEALTNTTVMHTTSNGHSNKPSSNSYHAVNDNASTLQTNSPVANLPIPSPTQSSTPPPKVSNNTPPPNLVELRKYKSVLDRLRHHPHYFAFGAPVDVELLQIPTYHDIIKKPMDFGTIRKKLDKGKYSHPEQLLKDAKQVFINCYMFNMPDDVVTQMGKELQGEFNRLSSARGLRTIEIDFPNEVGGLYATSMDTDN
ncbi:hypothetical protein EDC96DRAFT_469660 [Choanephora cucurbitarum]|nr:hypothetical protein EDC96DRAFT_469660 [Choanephora cucurbitarum]